MFPGPPKWYEEKKAGLGVAFVDRVLEATGRIAANPEGYALAFMDARWCQLSQFTDYGLWFQIRPDNSLVIGCLSGRRSPRLPKARVLGWPEP